MAFEREWLKETKKKMAAKVRHEKLDMAKTILATPDADDNIGLMIRDMSLTLYNLTTDIWLLVFIICPSVHWIEV
ncbi:hypothetical protein PILCRDRAFT_16963 [Piloderma croceum F 1598]|uniref:Uncharacterized protein n=1 Tax=Piloderma croceum (strain F 1598) TaxID=765440 RepID=A0A0C3B2S0_PILCF|nr:hypothetical protein PILCRDRAFT_16963 [Piloderma croceum F 1598]